jgi:cell division protein FtsW
LITDYKNGFFYLFIWVILISGLIFIQPNVSNGIILVLISLTILYVGGAKITHIIYSLFFSLLVSGTIAMLFSHSRNRILTFINSIQNGGDINIQVKQALLGLGSGGIFGMGIGHSRQSDLFLPEAYGDFIFAIMGEELGFIGSVAVLLGYLILFIAGIIIAKKARDRFGQMLAFGITFTIISYAFINIAVSVGLLPTTGLPLPFISYGGTSMIFLCISIGILINIAMSNSIQMQDITIKKSANITENHEVMYDRG